VTSSRSHSPRQHTRQTLCSAAWPPLIVALDAFVLRTVLVPAVMHLCGRANWWLPRWLDRRLSHLAIEPPAQ